MSWKEKMKEFGGADLAFLSEDGEVLHFVVVGEPVLLTGKYKGKVSEKIGCPVVTFDGFQLLVAGKRLARRLSKYEKNFTTDSFLAIRHGVQDDKDTTYELKVNELKEHTKKLFEIAKRDFKPAMIDDAVQAAQEVMQG